MVFYVFIRQYDLESSSQFSNFTPNREELFSSSFLIIKPKINQL